MPTEKHIQENLNENRSQLREALDNIDRAVRSFRDSLTLGQAPKARIDTVIRLRTMVDTLVAADAIRCCYLEQLADAGKKPAPDARQEALEALHKAARAEAPFGSRTRAAAERVTDLERGNPAFDRLHPAEKLVLEAKAREAARKAEEPRPLGRVIFDEIPHFVRGFDFGRQPGKSVLFGAPAVDNSPRTTNLRIR